MDPTRGGEAGREGFREEVGGETEDDGRRKSNSGGHIGDCGATITAGGVVVLGDWL